MNYFDKTDDPRRRWLIQALGAGFFSTLPIELLAQIFGSRPAKMPEGKSVFRVQGQVTVDGKPATLDSKVTPTSTVETGRDGEIIYVQGGQSYIQRGNSKVILERKEPAADSPWTSGIQLVTGALLSVFPRGSPTQIRTKTATVGIRGTGVYLESEPDQTYFCTCYGVADVSANDDPESRETAVSKHHDKPLYILSGAQKGRNIRNAPFVNHTDQELMLVETLVGRKPPFIFPKEEYSGPRREY
jgi:hypothetical protein